MAVDVGAGPVRKRGLRLRGIALPAGLRDRVRLVVRTQWQELGLLVVAALAILAIRASFLPWVSLDYTIFLSRWYAFLQQHGFAGLGKEFADYNVPYLYLLWIGTLTPVSGLGWVKLLSATADLALAAGAFALLLRLHVSRFAAAGAALLLLLLPEVLLNSAVWGQADSLYTALIVWALFFAVQRRSTPMWVLFALALSFKLQAVFVLPALVLAFLVHRHRFRSLLIAAGVFLVTYLPAIVAGRSIPSLLSIYTKQAAQYQFLSLDAPSLYSWVPNTAFGAFRRSGTLFAIAVCAVLLAVLLRYFRSHLLTDRTLLLVAVLFALLVPFLLPAMHERYFYTGGVLLFVLSMCQRRYLIAALAAQVVAVQAYTRFLFGVPPVLPVPLLVFIELGVIAALVWPLLVKRDLLHAPPLPAADRAPTPSPAP